VAKKDRHVFQALGLAQVVIEDGKVVSVSEPKLDYCPLYKKFRNLDRITPEAVKENVEFRIKDFGLCTENRKVRASDFMAFGASEIMSSALADGKIEAAVIACDGAGTAIVTDPELLEGLCGRISGLIETSPLKVVQDAVGRENILDPEECEINAVKGADMAAQRYQKFAVTVANPHDASAIRRKYGDRAVIVAVHTSAIGPKGAEIYFDNCDIVTACAGAPIRKEAGKRDIVVAGNKVEVYGVTDVGKQMVIDKLASLGRKPYDGEPLDEPRPLLNADLLSKED
jgi:putative methanogenesis marker protein 8